MCMVYDCAVRSIAQTAIERRTRSLFSRFTAYISSVPHELLIAG